MQKYQTKDSELFTELINRNKDNSSDDIVIDLKRLFLKFLHRWYYFVFALFFTVTIAYFFNLYTIPTYKVTSTLLIDNNSNGSRGSLESGNLLNGFGLNPGLQNIDNQIGILSSYSLIKKCINELPFEIEYYTRGKINKSSLYPYGPFTVIQDTSESIPFGLEFAVQFLGEFEFYITIEENDNLKLNRKAQFGEILKLGNFKFHIERNLTSWNSDLADGKNFYFVFHRPESLVLDYQKRLEINKISNEGTIIVMDLEGINSHKDHDFLSKLIGNFIISNLNNKNLEADRTITFIDNQLKGISDSLLIAENKLQEFRSRNRVMDISDQGSQVLEQAVRLEDEKSVLMIQADYYKYLSDYLSKDISSDNLIAPSTIGISDPSLVRLVEQLSLLQAEYMSVGGGERNPMRTNLKIRIQNTKEALIETLNSIIRNNDYAIEENKQRLRELNRRAEALPETERKLLGIERVFELNDALYTFLTQKQAEAQIQKASNAPDTEIIDLPRILPHQIKPNTFLNYLIAIFFGIFLPAGLIFIWEILNDRIETDNDLKKILSQPISGHILHMKKLIPKVVLSEPKSDVSESFRSLRTRLQFFTKNKKSPIILITSSMAGEGKSFVATNISAAYSLDNKNTVLVGLDLRRPSLQNNFEVTNEKGVSTYLIGKDTIDEIIHSSGYPYLDIIPSGPIPPNPSELINQERLNDLFKYLKSRYDYIVLDSAPIGIVSDSYELASKADACIYVVRAKVTPKPLLLDTLEDANSYGIKNIAVIFNDLKMRGNSTYSYRYKYASKKK